MKRHLTAYAFLVLAAFAQLGFVWDNPKKEQKSGNMPAASQNSAAKNAATTQAGMEIPFPQMMGALSQNLTLWPALSEDNKRKATEAAIAFYQNRENSAILRPADFYVQQIEASIKSNAALQGTDLMSLLKILAVMEYDFYNGQNKDELAKEVLGEKMYQEIRMRRGGI